LEWYSLLAYVNSGVNRPRYSALLPGKRYVDDYNYTEGNPYLLPAQSYVCGIQNTFFNMFNLTASVTFVNNLISQVKLDQDEGVTADTYMNAIDSRRYSLSVSAPFSLFGDKFSGNLNFTGSRGKYVNERNGFKLPEHPLQPMQTKLSGFFNYQLTSWMGVTANVLYNGGNNNLQTVADPYATLDLGVNMNLLKNKRLSVALQAADIFNSGKQSSKVYYGADNVFARDINKPTRYVHLAVSYRFQGGKQFNPRINSEKNDTGRFTQ
jgi:hypothetical protein